MVVFQRMIHTAQPSHAKPIEAIGHKLRRAREARHWTLDELSARTRIPVRHLETIESGRSEDLPGGFIGKSFVRQFAEAVGLNAERTLAEFVAQTGIDLEVPFQERKVSPYTPESLKRFQTQMWRKIGMAAVALVLLIALGIYAFRKAITVSQGPDPPQTPIADRSPTTSTKAAAPEPQRPATSATPEAGRAINTATDAARRLAASSSGTRPRNTNGQESDPGAADAAESTESASLSESEASAHSEPGLASAAETPGTLSTVPNQ
jgi:cytoskeletal protein RodZ